MIARAVSSQWFKIGVAVTAGAVIASVVTVSITQAGAAGSDTILGCVTNTTGEIVILSDPSGPTEATCPSKGAHEVTWSEEGPTGPQGPQGAAGSSGSGGLGASSSAISAQLSSALGGLASLSSQLEKEQVQQTNYFRIQQRFAVRHLPGFRVDIATSLKLLKPSVEELPELKDAIGELMPIGVAPLTLTKPVTGSSVANAVSTLQNDLDSDNEISEMTSMQLQMLMDTRSKLLQTLSNIMRTITETEEAIVQNLKS